MVRISCSYRFLACSGELNGHINNVNHCATHTSFHLLNPLHMYKHTHTHTHTDGDFLHYRLIWNITIFDIITDLKQMKNCAISTPYGPLRTITHTHTHNHTHIHTHIKCTIWTITKCTGLEQVVYIIRHVMLT